MENGQMVTAQLNNGRVVDGVIEDSYIDCAGTLVYILSLEDGDEVFVAEHNVIRKV
jgi:hypothetical protein